MTFSLGEPSDLGGTGPFYPRRAPASIRKITSLMPFLVLLLPLALPAAAASGPASVPRLQLQGASLRAAARAAARPREALHELARASLAGGIGAAAAREAMDALAHPEEAAARLPALEAALGPRPAARLAEAAETLARVAPADSETEELLALLRTPAEGRDAPFEASLRARLDAWFDRRPSATNGGHIAWLDLEMTGLDPDKESILEIAAVVTDKNLNVIAVGPNLVIGHSEEALARMDAWNTEHHGLSGLTDLARRSDVTPEEAERRLLAFFRRHTPAGTAQMAGNSIGHDRRFLERRMPALLAHFSHRVIDVTTIRLLADRWYPRAAEFAKTAGHRARQDILESIAQLRHYRRTVFRRRR